MNSHPAVELTPSEYEEMIYKSHFKENQTQTIRPKNSQQFHQNERIVGRRIDGNLVLEPEKEFRFKPKIISDYKMDVKHQTVHEKVNPNKTPKEIEVGLFHSRNEEALQKEKQRNIKLEKRKLLQKSYTFKNQIQNPNNPEIVFHKKKFGSNQIQKRNISKSFRKNKKDEFDSDSSYLIDSSDLNSSSEDSSKNEDQNSDRLSSDDEYNRFLNREIRNLNNFDIQNADEDIENYNPYKPSTKFQFSNADKIIKKLFKNKNFQNYSSSDTDNNESDYYTDSSSDSSIFIGDNNDFYVTQDKIKIQNSRKNQQNVFSDIVIKKKQLTLDSRKSRSKSKNPRKYSLQKRDKYISKSTSKPIYVRSIDTKFYPNYYAPPISNIERSLSRLKPEKRISRSKSESKVNYESKKNQNSSKQETKSSKLSKNFVIPEFMNYLYKSPKHKIDIIAEKHKFSRKKEAITKNKTFLREKSKILAKRWRRKAVSASKSAHISHKYKWGIDQRKYDDIKYNNCVTHSKSPDEKRLYVQKIFADKEPLYKAKKRFEKTKKLEEKVLSPSKSKSHKKQYSIEKQKELIEKVKQNSEMILQKMKEEKQLKNLRKFTQKAKLKKLQYQAREEIVKASKGKVWRPPANLEDAFKVLPEDYYEEIADHHIGKVSRERNFKVMEIKKKEMLINHPTKKYYNSKIHLRNEDPKIDRISRTKEYQMRLNQLRKEELMKNENKKKKAIQKQNLILDSNAIHDSLADKILGAKIDNPKNQEYLKETENYLKNEQEQIQKEFKQEAKNKLGNFIAAQGNDYNDFEFE